MINLLKKYPKRPTPHSDTPTDSATVSYTHLDVYKRQESYEAAALEKNMCVIGLSGMIDPIRPEVKDSIEECREMCIRDSL